ARATRRSAMADSGSVRADPWAEPRMGAPDAVLVLHEFIADRSGTGHRTAPLRGERRRSDSKRSPPAGGGDRRNVAQRSGGAGQAVVPPSPFPSFFPSSFSGRPGASSGPAAFGSSERACSSRSSRIAVDQGSEPASESA